MIIFLDINIYLRNKKKSDDNFIKEYKKVQKYLFKSQNGEKFFSVYMKIWFVFLYICIIVKLN